MNNNMNIESERANILLKLTETFLKAQCENKVETLDFIKDNAHIYECVGKKKYVEYLNSLQKECQDMNIIVKQYRVAKTSDNLAYVEYYYIKSYKDVDGKVMEIDSRAEFTAERISFDENNQIVNIKSYDTRKVADPRRTAFIILDAQETIVRGFMSPSNEDDKQRFEQCVDVIEKSLNHARFVQMPVVHVKHSINYNMKPNTRLMAFCQENGVLKPNGKDGEIISELAPISNETVITKTGINAFANGDLTSYLRANDINTVVLVGFVAHYAVYSAAIGAADCGFNVAVLTDGTVSGRQASYDNTMLNLKNVVTLMTSEEFKNNF